MTMFVRNILIYTRGLGVVSAAAVSAVLTASAGCERKGVQEQTVAKGVEQVPEPPAQGGASREQQDDSVQDSWAANDWPWTTPDGWTEDPQPRQMRLTTYVAPDPSGPVEVAVTRFAGRVGGDLANINRWRGQMGLSPLAESNLETAIERFSSPGYEGYEVRVESGRGVMLAAGVYQESTDQMWFVRTTVSEPAIADRLESSLFGMARSIAGLDQ